MGLRAAPSNVPLFAVCAQFEGLSQSGLSKEAVKTIGLISVIAVSATALIVILIKIFFVLRPHCRRSVHGDSSCRERCQNSSDALSRLSVVGNSVCFVLLLTPCLFYSEIFLPCFDCIDFEAAAVHEIGHILGLTHPDTAAPGRNVCTHSVIELRPDGC